MLGELMWTPLSKGPGRARGLARMLGSFRKQRELLREVETGGKPLAELQYRVPAEQLGVDPAELREAVEEWMYERPLKHLRPHLRRGTVEFLERARRSGMRLGVFSDYPVQAKLRALGIDQYFDCMLDATDPAVNAFKPDPKGFLVCAERLGVAPEHVLYVGDRPEVDGEGARRAGMASVVLSDEPMDDGHRYANGFEEVWSVLRRSA